MSQVAPTPSPRTAIAMVLRAGPQAAQRLANVVGIQPEAVYTILAKMEADGVVTTRAKKWQLAREHHTGSAPGRYLGGVRDLETLRCRCVIDGDCWRFRGASGRPMPKDRGHYVWTKDRGVVSAPKLAWEYSAGRSVSRGSVVYRTCDSYDCINPQHLKCATKAEFGHHLKQTGRLRGDPRRAAICRRNSAKRVKVSPELREWIFESQQMASDIAHGLDVTISRISTIRREEAMRGPFTQILRLAA